MIEIFVKSFIICKNDEFLITDLQTDYQQITESFLYTVIQTCSDFITAFLKLSQFNVKITDYHFKAQIRILQYVRNTLDYDIIYINDDSIKSDNELAIYSDIDYISNSNIQKSTSDYIIMFYDRFIS